MRLPLALPVLLVVLAAAPARAAVTAESGGFFAGGRALPSVDSKVTIEVDGPFADVVVKQTFRNDLERGIEAVYVFPLPADAAVSSMVIRTGDRTITAQVASRADARAAYEEAVAQGVVAALVEQERANIFTQQVTGIEAGATVSVELRFDMGLGRWRDGWELVLPLVVAPRHVPGAATGKATSGTGSAPDTDEVGDASRVTPPVRSDRGGNPIEVVIDIVDDGLEQIEVPSHAADIESSRGKTRITTRDARSDRDLVVRWKAPAAGAATALTERSSQGDVVALVVETPRGSEKRRQRRRWLLVLDVSGSMDGDALLMLRDAAHALIDQAGADQVAVLGPAGGSLKWRRGERGLALARKTVDSTDASGGTALGELLGTALADAGEDVAVMVISDGLVADDAAVAARVDGARARVHAIGVGPAPNRWLLEELARRGRGSVTVLGTGDDVDAAVRGLVASAGAPVVTPTIDWGGLAVREGSPSTLPALAAGRAIVVTARIDRVSNATIAVRIGKRRLEAKVDGDSVPQGHVLARRWARARIDELVGSGGHAAEIAALGLAHSLVTPYTALIARGEQVTVEGGVRTTVAIPVAMPAGMRWQSVFGPDGDSGAPVQPTVIDSDVAAADPSGAGGGGDDRDGVDDEEVGEDRTATSPPPMAEPTASGSSIDSYDAETIQVSGRVIMGRTWTGTLDLRSGLHVRGEDSSPTLGLQAGAFRALSRAWKLGLTARLQLAPGVDGGTDAAAYATVRRFVAIDGMPVAAIDLGLGPSLDVVGVAWRVGLRLGPWRFAPVIGVDQARTPDDDGGGWSSRTTVDVGIEWSF